MCKPITGVALQAAHHSLIDCLNKHKGTWNRMSGLGRALLMCKPFRDLTVHAASLKSNEVPE